MLYAGFLGGDNVTLQDHRYLIETGIKGVMKIELKRNEQQGFQNSK